jgi:hypothetical protein
MGRIPMHNYLLSRRKRYFSDGNCLSNIFYVAIGNEKTLVLMKPATWNSKTSIQIYTCLSNCYDWKVDKKSQKHWLHCWLRKFVSQNPYRLFDWYAILGVQNKWDKSRWCTEILKSLSLKSYSGYYKIMISDKLNTCFQ